MKKYILTLALLCVLLSGCSEYFRAWAAYDRTMLEPKPTGIKGWIKEKVAEW
jgi:PBP1b-binding outer membrane lipoprotein LpoB